MNAQTTDKIIAVGEWPTKEQQGWCATHPRGQHKWKDIKRTPSRVNIGEYLVTTRCTVCGVTIKDCPTISA